MDSDISALKSWMSTQADRNEKFARAFGEFVEMIGRDNPGAPWVPKLHISDDKLSFEFDWLGERYYGRGVYGEPCRLEYGQVIPSGEELVPLLSTPMNFLGNLASGDLALTGAPDAYSIHWRFIKRLSEHRGKSELPDPFAS